VANNKKGGYIMAKVSVKVSPDEATRFVEAILDLKREKVITDLEAKDALKRIPYYCDIIQQ
jgi:hypothetical protein